MNGNVGDGSWELEIIVTNLTEGPRRLRVKGDLHIGGLILQLVDTLRKLLCTVEGSSDSITFGLFHAIFKVEF